MSQYTQAELEAMSRGEDWIEERTWDTWPPTVDSLLIALGVENEPFLTEIQAVKHFMTLPAAKPMLAELRCELQKQRLL